MCVLLRMFRYSMNGELQVFPINSYTGWPRKNATPTITNFKEIGTKSN